MDKKAETPSKSIINKVKLTSVSCDSPFRLLPNGSTPPSRLKQIINPFDVHLLDRVHLPIFSPTVFAKVSTPKKRTNFRWSIDEISSLKPADIDESTINQQENRHDPHYESAIQEKINTYFLSDKSILPSPMNKVIKSKPIMETQELGVYRNVESPCTIQNPTVDGCTQTVLTLPPILPKHIEDVLQEFLTYNDDQQQKSSKEKIYSELFENCDETEIRGDECSEESSPAPSLALSPIHFSPIWRGKFQSPDSKHMSIDTTFTDNSQSLQFSRKLASIEEISDSSMNWDMEYKELSFIDDPSPTSTPKSKIFFGHRKRLSDSFADKKLQDKNCMSNVKDSEIIEFQNTDNHSSDAGYQTASGTNCTFSTRLFNSKKSI